MTDISAVKAWFRGGARDSGSYRMGGLLVDEIERLERERMWMREALFEALHELEEFYTEKYENSARLENHLAWANRMRELLRGEEGDSNENYKGE